MKKLLGLLIPFLTIVNVNAAAPKLLNKTLETDYFIITYNSETEKLAKDSEIELTKNLTRIMDFFALEKLSNKIKVEIYPTLDDWIKFIESCGKKYQDYIVGTAFPDKICVLAFDEYSKTRIHKNDTFDDYLKVIIHECVHFCNQEKIENGYNSVLFIMEGLATYLANQPYNPNIKADYSCEIMCDPNQLFQLKDPYSISQIYVRKMLEKLPPEKVIEYSADIAKLRKDWDTIF